MSSVHFFILSQCKFPCLGLCCQWSKGRITLPNQMNFQKNSRRPSTPPPHFRKIILQFFCNGYGCIYAGKYECQIVWNAFFKVCLVLIFLNTTVEKAYPGQHWNDSFVSISCSISPVWSSKMCIINFWNENDHPPPFLEAFRKFIRFGVVTHP